VLPRTRPHQLRLATPDRWLWVVLSRIRTERQAAPQIVQPEMIIASERRGFLPSSMALQRQISLQMNSLRDLARVRRSARRGTPGRAPHRTRLRNQTQADACAGHDRLLVNDRTSMVRLA